MRLTAEEIAAAVGALGIEGDRHRLLMGFASLKEAGPSDLSFFSDPRYETHLYQTQAGAVLVPDTFEPRKPLPPYPTWIRVARPDHAFYTLVRQYKLRPLPHFGQEPQAFIHPTAEISPHTYIGSFAYIGEKAKIADHVWIFPFAYIGPEVEIGEHTIVYPHAVLMPGTRLGQGCIIHPGAVIGADGFGFYQGVHRPYEKIPQVGRVVLEDEVEVGANTCIDRATLGETRVEEGVKLDNLIQVGHNVRIGHHTAIAAQTGIAGSSTLGAFCRIGGQVGIVDHVQVADHSSITAQSGISRSITTPGRSWRGSPAQEVRQQLMVEAIMRKLPELYHHLQQIEKIISQT